MLTLYYSTLHMVCHYSLQGQLEDTRDPPERCCGHYYYNLQPHAAAAKRKDGEMRYLENHEWVLYLPITMVQPDFLYATASVMADS